MSHFRSRRVYDRFKKSTSKNFVRLNNNKKYFWCNDCGRQKFRYTEKEAQTALKFQKQVCRAYRCPTCSEETGEDVYHLTSKR